MATTLYFYDLETSGFNPRDARIMQFAGQRTDLDLKPIAPPDNYFIKMTADVLPEPDAILITGITPQKTLAEGLSEAEFLKEFHAKIALPETIFTGFNSIRFDDEFMRFINYRNFYDAYEWQWRDSKSRWDLLDVVRMTRALRPDGIKWPLDAEGKPTNRLELLAGINKLEHESAHDALSDVRATIALARLLKSKQPKLFDYLLSIRNKKDSKNIAASSSPFLYTSGKYESKYEKTTAVGCVAEHPQKQGVLVFDLRYDPNDFFNFSPEELATMWTARADDGKLKLPIKTLQFNRCPAIAPLSVLDEKSQRRLALNPVKINEHFKSLKSNTNFTTNILKALDLLDKHQQTRMLSDQIDVDARLYDDFFSNDDQTKMSLVRASDKADLKTTEITFEDDRLRALLPLYKARNFPGVINDEEREIWELYRSRKLIAGKTESRISRYYAKLGELHKSKNLSKQHKYLLEELDLYGQSIISEEY